MAINLINKTSLFAHGSNWQKISLSLSWHIRFFMLLSPLPCWGEEVREQLGEHLADSQGHPLQTSAQIWLICKLPGAVGLGFFPEAVKCYIHNKPCTGFTCQCSSKVFNRLLIVLWNSKHADTDCPKYAFSKIINSHSWQSKKNLKMYTCIWFSPWFHLRTHKFLFK